MNKASPQHIVDKITTIKPTELEGGFPPGQMQVFKSTGGAGKTTLGSAKAHPLRSPYTITQPGQVTGRVATNRHIRHVFTAKQGQVVTLPFWRPAKTRTAVVVSHPTTQCQTRCTAHGFKGNGTKATPWSGVFYAQGYAEAHKGVALFSGATIEKIVVERRALPKVCNANPGDRVQGGVKIVFKKPNQP